MRRHREKMAVYRPRRETSEETSLADPLISNLQPSEQGGNKLLLFKAPCMWYFVTAAPAYEYTSHAELPSPAHLAVLGLRCCLGFSLVAASGGLSLVVVLGLHAV